MSRASRTIDVLARLDAAGTICPGRYKFARVFPACEGRRFFDAVDPHASIDVRLSRRVS